MGQLGSYFQINKQKMHILKYIKRWWTLNENTPELCGRQESKEAHE